jgi:hypothetical protein
MRLVLFGSDEEGDALAPGLVRDRLHATLLGGELAQAVFGAEQKTFEIAQAVRAEAGDLAFRSPVLLATLVFVLMTAAAALALTAEAGDFPVTC